MILIMDAGETCRNQQFLNDSRRHQQGTPPSADDHRIKTSAGDLTRVFPCHCPLTEHWSRQAMATTRIY